MACTRADRPVNGTRRSTENCSISLYAALTTPAVELRLGDRRTMAWSAGVRRETVNQAARRLSRNLPTSSLRRLLSDDGVCAAESTCDEADPVSEAPR